MSYYHWVYLAWARKTSLFNKTAVCNWKDRWDCSADFGPAIFYRVGYRCAVCVGVGVGVVIPWFHVTIYPMQYDFRCNSLQWRHNERDGVYNNRRFRYLSNRLFRHRSKTTSKLRVTVVSPHKGPITRKYSIWWRHHVLVLLTVHIGLITHIIHNVKVIRRYRKNSSNH